MRKSTKAILIALAVLIGPAIYMGYLLYRESKVVDLVSVEVTDDAGQKLSGIVVDLTPQWDKNRRFQATNEFTKDGIARFYDIPPGEYRLRILYPKTDCDSFKFRIEGVRVKVYIQMSLNDCSMDMIVTPK